MLSDHRCEDCGLGEPEVKFYASSGEAAGYRSRCTQCYMTKYKTQNPEAPLTGATCPVCDVPIRGNTRRVYCSTKCSMHGRRLRNDYDLSVAEWRALCDQTGGRCPICLKRSNKAWHVDHSHKTREITGAVCGRCNTGALAYTYHDLEYVRRLLTYLENPPAALLGLNKKVPVEANRPSNLHSIWKPAL